MREFELTITLQPISLRAELFEASVTLRHRDGTTYRARGIAGPDGWIVIDDRLSPRLPERIGERSYAPRHDYTDAEIAAAVVAKVRERLANSGEKNC